MVKQKEDTESLMTYMGVAYAQIDLRTYKVIHFNHAMTVILGYSEEVLKEQFHLDMHLYFTGEYTKQLEKLKDIVNKAQQEGKEHIQLDLQIPSRHGARRIVGAGSFGTEEVQGEQVPCLRVLYQDITDLDEASSRMPKDTDQEFLAHENRRMQSILNKVPGGLSTIRIVDGKVVSMRLNQWFQEHVDIKGVVDDVLDIKLFTQCLHPDDREAGRRDFYQFLEKGDSITGQYRFRRKDTDTYDWCSVRGSKEILDEHTELAYFTFTDINEIKLTENALRQSRQLYEHSVDSLHLGIWTYDIKNHRIIMGKNTSTIELCKRFHWPEVFENAPESTYETIIETDLPAYQKMFEEIHAGRDASCEVWYKDDSGLEPYCERESYHVVSDENGYPLFAYGVGQNITADRKVKERYVREMDFLRSNHGEDLVAKGRYNLSKNIVLEYENIQHDKASQPFVGGTYDSFIELLLTQAFREEDRKVIGEKLNRKNLIRRYQEGQMQDNMLYQKKFDGDPFWVSLTIHTYMRPETNDLELFSYAYDITENKLLETMMELISGHAFDYIGIIDVPKDTFELIRKADDITLTEAREKITYEQLRTRIKKIYISADELQRYENATSLDHILQQMKENNQYTTTYLIEKNERTLCKQIDCLWLDQPNGQILVVRSDVTEAYEREQQYTKSLEMAKLEAERANDEKSAFLSGMSHDMRTPLNGILSYTNFAIKENDPEKKQEYLTKIAGSGNLLLDLVDDTLELSRIESGKVQTESESFSLNDLITTIITSLKPSAEAKQISFDIALQQKNDDLLWGDRRKLQKILLNLLTNSIKYTHPKGYVKLQVQEKQQNQVSGYVFIIADNGIGMSQEFMKRMYEPFSQEKRSESAETPGTGLGLSIVKKYVDILQGTIEVESTIHQGTKWTVFIPMEEAEEREKTGQKELVLTGSLKGKHVLLCEDNRMNTEIALVLLKDMGVTADTASNGKEGVSCFEKSREGTYDAVLMDIQMPVMNGNEAAQAIRNLSRSDAKTVPIIAMSADVFEESMRAAKKAGMNDYITKPIEPEKFYQVLAKACHCAK